ncbi:MAG: aldehyde dehydrogenase family protein [Planctomycetes bacterium]|nr:aldehyde dehydrogenase family protein [Planctomycetota bacterium]
MSQSLPMSAAAASRAETVRAEMDRSLATLKESAQRYARLSVADRLTLLRGCVSGIEAVAREWVVEGCRAKGLDPDSPGAGEEWLVGPVITLRNVRLLIESLEEIRVHGRPRLGQGVRTRPDGRVEVDVFPTNAMEAALFAGFKAHLLLQPGVDARAARERQAEFYQRRDPAGSVSLVLGAGNVSSIPPMDAFYKLFVEGKVCLLKMNPVNEWVGPILERALAPLVSAGYLRFAYGGAETGTYLVNHDAVDDVHITGSDRTHDFIVWGPPGPERERRKRENDPLLKKRITSELGNVSPVAIVPGVYSDSQLWFQARNVATMVGNNGSFNCNAAKILVTSKSWPQRAAFLDRVRKALGETPLRKAYYPGASERYESLLAGHAQVEKFGAPAAGQLAWAFVPGLDAESRTERLYEVEPFCGILSEVPLAAADPVEFLRAATLFMNDRLWGTLNAAIVIAPRDERDATIAVALDRAIVDLRYGSVAVNHWPALAYALVTPAWGGHPSGTLADPKSGLGWVHNSFMVDGIEKSVVRGPITVFPKPAWFVDNRQTHRLGERLLAFEASPSWLKIPALALTSLRG